MARFFILIILSLVSFGYTTPTVAQDDRLVAMVRVKYDGEIDRVGAAIILDHGPAGATLATAAHTITGDGLGENQTVDIEFLATPGEEYAAEVKLIHSDPALDLAVLFVPLPATHSARKDFSKAKRALLPEPLAAEAGDGVFAIGFPGERAWRGNKRRDILRRIDAPGVGNTIAYESSITVPGMSGGALFGEYGALLGMVVEVSATEARALKIEKIVEEVKAANLPSSLAPNPDVITALAAQSLEAAGHNSVDALTQRFNQPQLDFPNLHLYWIAGFGADDVKNFFRRRAPGDERTNAEIFFYRSLQVETCESLREGANDRTALVIRLALAVVPSDAQLMTCADHMMLWLREALRGGVDPDLILTLSDGYEGSLLAAALKAKATEASLVLLENGATPNAYIDLEGLRSKRNPFTHPLEYVAENFTGADVDRLWNAMIKAEVVATEDVDNAGMRTVPNLRTLRETKTDAPCSRREAHSGGDWCTTLRSLPEYVLVNGFSGIWNQVRTGLGPIKLGQTLFIGEHRAFISASANSTNGKRTIPFVVEINPATGEWLTYGHDDGYGCRRRADGTAPIICWRGYKTHAGTAAMAVPPVINNDNPIARVKLNDIGLATPLLQAVGKLNASGFEQRTLGDPADFRDQIMTIDFERKIDDRRYVTMTLVAINDLILGVHLSGPPEETVVSGITELVAARSTLGYYSSEKPFETRVTMAAITDAGRHYALHETLRQSDSIKFHEASVFIRNRTEAIAEASYWRARINDWLTEPRKASGGTPCLDDYRFIRTQNETSCLTLTEYSAKIMKKNREKVGVTVLPSGVQYEILEQGDGEQMLTGDSVNYQYKQRRYDNFGRNNTQSGGRDLVVGRPFVWTFYNDVFPKLKIGAKVRFLMPPVVFNYAAPKSLRARLPVVYEAHIYRLVERGVSIAPPPSAEDANEPAANNETNARRRRR